MKKEIMELINSAIETVKEFNLSYDLVVELQKLQHEDYDINKIIEEIDKILDEPLQDKFINDYSFEYKIDEYENTSHLNKDIITYYIGNGLFGYQFKDKRFLTLKELEEYFEDLE